MQTKEQIKKYQRVKRAFYNQKGKCIECGALVETYRCEFCQSKQRERNRKHYALHGRKKKTL